jgi:hypothetical protein
MPLSPALQIGLKEWDSVCTALQEGRQIVLLRKGGISEHAGQFTVEHAQFLLFPTFLHQKKLMLKPAAQAGFQERSTEPDEIHLSTAGIVTDIIQLQTRQQMDLIDDTHIWTAPLIDMRFNYRPENPLYLMLVRAYRMAKPVDIHNTPAYAGCKSWVPLDQTIDTANSAAAITDADYESRRQKILQLLRVR